MRAKAIQKWAKEIRDHEKRENCAEWLKVHASAFEAEIEVGLFPFAAAHFLWVKASTPMADLHK